MNAAAPAAGTAMGERAATADVDSLAHRPPGAPRATTADSGRRPTHRPTDPPTPTTKAQTRTLVALAVITAFGAFLRAHGFSSVGFFRDDAWVALSTRQGLGTAVHMWVAAPGYMFVLRIFMLSGPHTTWWAQIPAFVAGVACIPAMYALARHLRLSRVAGLVTAGVVSMSPMAAIYSTRLKVYETDFLLSCVLLALAETTRRNPGRRQVATLAIASVLAFICSASVAAVIAGAWIMVAWCTMRGSGRPRPRHVLLGITGTAVACGVVALVAYSHVSSTISRWWPYAFISHSSPAALVGSFRLVTWGFLAPLFGFWRLSAAAQAPVVLFGVVLVVAGAYKNRAMLAPAVTLGIAYAASAAQRVPLGTGRTDLYLYPVVLVLMAAGATRLVRGARAVASRYFSESRFLPVAVVGLALVVGAGVVLQRTVAEPPSYPGVDIQAIAGAIAQHEQPGDRIFVSELARFSWVEALDAPVTLRFGEQWAPGFTVVSRDPQVFLAPSEYLEGGFRPAAWATAEDRADAHRLWYVWSPPLAVDNPSYAALRADGWRPVRTLHAVGIDATLLVRS